MVRDQLIYLFINSRIRMAGRMFDNQCVVWFLSWKLENRNEHG